MIDHFEILLILIKNNNDKADKNITGLYSAISGNYGCYSTFSNYAWGTCQAVVWIPHSSSLTFTLVEVSALGDGNLSTNVTSSCSINTDRLQYLTVICTDSSVAHKLVNIIFSVK